jgi:phosphotransferase family enzyme
MQHGRFARPRRHGDTIERAISPASGNVHALLAYLERRGFALAPRLRATTADGTREILSYLPGDSGYPPLASELRRDETLVSVTRAVRDLHDATQGFVAPQPDHWHRMELAVPAVIDCIGHGDLAPWNILFVGTRVTGIIDWDTAGPTNRVWELAYLAHHLVPFHPTEDLAGFGWDTEPDRAGRLRLLTGAYGHDVRLEPVVDFAALRLLAMAAHLDDRVHAADAAYTVHRDEDTPPDTGAPLHTSWPSVPHLLGHADPRI